MVKYLFEDVQKILEDYDNLQIHYQKEFPGRNADYVSAEGLGLLNPLIAYINQKYPDGLFTHQAEALKYILKGQNTVVATRTSSGKSLIFTLPVFNRFISEPKSTALFIYPQNALANDQFAKLNEIYGFIKQFCSSECSIERYVGATPEEQRKEIREKASIILTNPDMLHIGILPNHNKWKRFFSNLKYVIIDEAHAYRGVFGSNVAYIFRRLLAICASYGSKPVFISTSATIDEPKEHLKKLTGLGFHEIGQAQDGSLQGSKKFWLVRGKMQHFYQIGKNLTKIFVDNHYSCLTFCPSRKVAERLLSEFSEEDIETKKIAVYRAGLSHKEREDIENGLKTGKVKAVFSTTALELGIDIGTLDIVVCVGLPNTMMSLWQQAGRVGRQGKKGAIIFVAADKPLDTYYCENPEEFFNKNFEKLALNLENRRIVCNHLACAIYENGGELMDLNFEALGETMEHAVNLRKAGSISDEIFYDSEPHARTPVRNSEDSNYSLMIGDEKIGEIDYWHLIREAYHMGIYLHGGKSYRVSNISRKDKCVYLKKELTRNLTFPLINTTFWKRKPFARVEYPHLTILKGMFEITAKLVNVTEKKRDGEMIKVYNCGLGSQVHRLPTEGVCLEMPYEWVSKSFEENYQKICSAVKAVERMYYGLFPVIAGPCDSQDYSTLSDCDRKRLCWLLYDQVRDGIGLTIQVFESIRDLNKKAIEQINSCKCEEETGCFCCIRNPEFEEPVTKKDALILLEILDKELSSKPIREETFEVDKLISEDNFMECKKCHYKIRVGDRFCSNCGERCGE